MNTNSNSTKSTVEKIFKLYKFTEEFTQYLHQLNKTLSQVVVMILDHKIWLRSTKLIETLKAARPIRFSKDCQTTARYYRCTYNEDNQ